MNLGELSGVKLLGVLLLVAAVGTTGLYYTVFKSQRDQKCCGPDQAAGQTARERGTRSLPAETGRHRASTRQLETATGNRTAHRADEKEVDNFMRMVSGEARKSGVEIRRYTSRPYVAKEFYTEVPFEVELDGPYYSMLGFFDRLGKVERIVNISNLLVASTPSRRCQGEAYLPVRAGRECCGTCLTTTYFSHDLDPAGRPASPDTGEEIGGHDEASVSDNDDNSRLRTGRGLASAQKSQHYQNTRNTMNTVSSNATAASNEALAFINQPSGSERHACSGQVERSRGVKAVKPSSSSSTAQAGTSSAGAKKTGGAKSGSGSRGRAQGASEASPYGSEKQSASGGQCSHNSQGARKRAERRAGRSGRQIRANGRRILYQSVVSHAGGSGCQHRQEVSGNRGHQPARCGACRERLYAVVRTVE